MVTNGTRAVVVIDRGWIFAGDVEVNHHSTSHSGSIILTNVVHVQSWSSVGFDGMISNPVSKNVNIKRMEEPVEVPNHSIIFQVPVKQNWGL